MRLFALHILSALLVLASATFALGAAPSTTSTMSTAVTLPVMPAPVVVIVLEGEINDYKRDWMFRRFAEARELGAQAVVLRIDTYGGLVTSALEMSRFLKRQDDLHVIAF